MVPKDVSEAQVNGLQKQINGLHHRVNMVDGTH
jgi:hypothetical protein